MTMTEVQHTPGPWRPHHNGATRVIAPVPGEPNEVHTICNTWSSAYSPPRWEAAANARLIAAAPELLAALRGLLANACRPGDDGKYDDAFDDARTAAWAAVLKATSSCVACREPATKAYLGRPDMPWCGSDKCGLRIRGGIDAHESGCNR